MISSLYVKMSQQKEILKGTKDLFRRVSKWSTRIHSREKEPAGIFRKEFNGTDGRIYGSARPA